MVDEVVVDQLVDGDALLAMAVAADGTVMPVSVGSIEFTRSSEWSQYVVGREFNSVFYSALKAVGVGSNEGQAAISLLMDHRLFFGLTPIQVRVAYGVEKGVIGRNYRFKPSMVDGSDWELRLIAARAEHGDGVGRGAGVRFDARAWERIETSALAACMGLPDQVDIATEFRWIRCNLHQSPYFKDAPSQGAVKDWLTIMRPGGVDPMLRDFTNLAWSKRLSPGDRANKVKSSAFEEDKVSIVDDADFMNQLNRRLGQRPDDPVV